ncbi:reverse transcriptase [Caerostris darwini]|uniref:RNA-directed DNA polymerase n=1 Tax=Caerostris darwini TaxID=1538125 RepID=A0AAV4RLV8_9ARAC|nr:reverse transcriptase [Caerostris darwini]
MKSESEGLPYRISAVTRAQVKLHEEDQTKETRSSGNDDKTTKITWEDHTKGLCFDRINKANLRLKPWRCKFAQKYVKYLGHIVRQGLRTSEEVKVQTIKDYPPPNTKTEVITFSGLVGYHGQYIPMSSVIASLLTTLKRPRRKGKVQWTETCDVAFQKLQELLCNKPTLHALGFNKQFIVQTDASDYGRGIFCRNERKNKTNILFRISLSNVQLGKENSVHQKTECAATAYFYLDGHQSFLMQTDPNPLTWLHSNANSNTLLMRWTFALQPYNLFIALSYSTCRKFT